MDDLSDNKNNGISNAKEDGSILSEFLDKELFKTPEEMLDKLGGLVESFKSENGREFMILYSDGTARPLSRVVNVMAENIRIIDLYLTGNNKSQDLSMGLGWHGLNGEFQKHGTVPRAASLREIFRNVLFKIYENNPDMMKRLNEIWKIGYERH
ncbi:MAG: hypothetical protein ABI721_03905 [Candidatus Dojkabacteria bacterium]